MPHPAILPAPVELKKLTRQGLTHQQIADRYGVTRAAVTRALNDAGVHTRPRYDAFIPWRVRVEHSTAFPLQMLRVAAKLELGKPVSEKDLRQFESWKAKLKAAKAVVHYDPDTIEGWFYVPRERGDQELIRPPKAGEGR